jgi:uncharacterized protein YdhG (YjbR/CyaY superfamily)
MSPMKKSSGRKPPADVDAYIASFPDDVRPVLQKLRAIIHKAIPRATEAISYRIPTFKLDGKYVIYFAAFKSHVGVYPAPVDDPAFKVALGPYRSGRASARFTYDKPLPTALLAKLVRFRARQTQAKADAKTKK